jgi:hypothetical protein
MRKVSIRSIRRHGRPVILPFMEVVMSDDVGRGKKTAIA